MLNPNTDGLVTVSVINIIASGAGFGVVMGSGSNCIIPSRVIYAADLRPGDLIRCQLVDNPTEEFRFRTPYMVSYVDPNETAALRIAVNAGNSVHQVVIAPPKPEQLNLPFKEALQSQAPKTMDEVLAAWDDDDPSVSAAAVAPPAPPQETAAEVKELVNLALDSGGMWTTGQLRDELWPNEDFGSGDYRYKLLTNVVRDLHMSGAVAAVGRRNSMRGLLTNAHYTKEPQKVRFVWED